MDAQQETPNPPAGADEGATLVLVTHDPAVAALTVPVLDTALDGGLVRALGLGLTPGFQQSLC